MTDVNDHLHQKAGQAASDAYTARWDGIYEELKRGEFLPFNVFSATSTAMEDSEAARQLLSRMARDIAELQKGRP